MGNRAAVRRITASSTQGEPHGALDLLRALGPSPARARQAPRRMRIAYACYWDLFTADGVTAKIAGQVRAWRAAGHEAQVFCLCPAPVGQASAALDAVRFVFSDGRTRIAETRRLARAVEDHDPD